MTKKSPSPEIPHYFVSGLGVTVECSAYTIMGWIDWILEHGGVPQIERIV